MWRRGGDWDVFGPVKCVGGGWDVSVSSVIVGG